MRISLIILELCPGQSSKSKNKRKTVTPKLGKEELRLLPSAHLPSEIYQPTQFHIDISYTFRVMSRTIFF
jgi:hypothetical protein